MFVRTDQDGSRAGFRKVAFFLNLDDGQGPKKMETSIVIIVSSLTVLWRYS